MGCGRRLRYALPWFYYFFHHQDTIQTNVTKSSFSDKSELASIRQCSYIVNMSNLRFDWDPTKAKANLRKHCVSFEETATVFLDERAIEFYDDTHSSWEDRMLILGLSSKLKLLLVCHCYREEESLIRIISARKATKNEAKQYQR